MKTNIRLFFLCCLLLPLASLGQAALKRVQIHTPRNREVRAKILGAVGIDHFESAGDGSIVAELSADEYARLQQLGLPHQVLVPDVSDWLAKENAQFYAARQAGRAALEQPSSSLGSVIRTPASFEVKSTFGGYYTFAEITAAINTLVANYSTIAQKISLGKTAEGRDIWCVKISDNVATDETGEPELLYIGLQHAREAITGSSMIFFMQYLCENYASNASIRDLVDNREIFIIPCMNPDGWQYNYSNNSGNAGGGWRKNRSKVDSSKQGQNWTYTYGVDLNRNWGVDWGNCSSPILGPGSSCGSGIVSDETYYGKSAFSEKETSLIRDFVLGKHIVAGFDQHAYGPYYSLPYGRKSLHTEGLPQKQKDFFTTIPAMMGLYNGMRAADSYDALGYEVAGGFKDWMLMGSIGVGTKDTVYAMTGEGGAGGGGNYGSYSSFWAPASQIENLCQGMCYQNLQLAYAAGTYVDLQDAGDLSLSGTSGSLSYSIRRIGLGNDPVTVTLVPIENIQAVGSPVTTNSLSYNDTVIRRISYTLSPTVTNGARIRYAWKVSAAGISYSDTITRVLNPTQLFYDDMEGSLSTNWTASSNVADNWGFTTAAAYGGSKSLTESPAGNYTSSTTRTLTYSGGTGSFNLASANSAYLTFWVKHRAENFRDKLQVQVSTNGTTWTAIAGNLTVQEGGTLDGSTLNGQPALTGIRDQWTKAWFDLSSYSGTALRLRFVFTSDNDPSTFKYEVDDGFYIDNIAVLKGTLSSTVLPSRVHDLTARLLPNASVQLNWAAGTDASFSHFEVERSADGNRFSTLGRVEASAAYTLVDAHPLEGMNYYRIRQVEKNGTASWSEVAAVDVSAIRSLQVYPNPVQSVVTIRYSLLQSSPVRVTITDLQGRVVRSEQRSLSAGAGTLQLNMEDLPGQTYLIRVQSAQGITWLQQALYKL